jgi:hypothetical protein
MKKLLLTSIIAVYASAIEMPPAIPMLDIKDDKKTTPTKKSKNPKECDMLPPMVVFLPPPMEKMVNECKNKLYIPSKEMAQKGLSKILKRKVKVKSVKLEDGFAQAYEIDIYSEKYICNKTVTKCFKKFVIK